MPVEEWINFTLRKDVNVSPIRISANITMWYKVSYEHFQLVKFSYPLIIILRRFVIKYLLHHISLFFFLHISFFKMSISKFNIFTVVVVICYRRDVTFWRRVTEDSSLPGCQILSLGKDFLTIRRNVMCSYSGSTGSSWNA